jgi:hypothetical protein
MKKPPFARGAFDFSGQCIMQYHQKAKPRFSGNAPHLRALARELGGEVRGPNWIEAPAPGRPDADRSLQISLSHSAPDGFTIISRLVSRHEARVYVAAALERVRNGRPNSPDLFGGQ